MSRVLIAAVALASACVVEVDYTNTRFTCADGVCPPGFDCVEGVCLEQGQPPDAGDDNRGFERQLAVDHSAGAGPLVDFPLMIRLDPTRIEYDACQPDGSDVRFVDAAGAPLAFELERWEPGGVSVFWVEIPTVEASATGATLSMRYGDGSTATPDPAAVWSGHHAVYHLADASDSSPTGFDGTISGTVDTIEGAVGTGLHFSGDGSFVDLGTDRAFLRAQSAATASAWVRLAADWAAPGAAFATSIDALQMPTNTSRLQLLVRDDRTFEGDARSLDGGGIISVIGPAVELETWTYLAFTVDFANDRIELFIDGSSVAVGEGLGLDPTSADSVSTQSTIGRGELEATDIFNGDLDEVRLSHTVRTADEIGADHRSMTDQMVTFGPATPLP